ncbi:unannotated protein [freshwater metagenome]|uniref:Unannotated protein n=1 Tax=freshwater metagenome TaxID=449393 RepID=A0A6J6XMW0_9ZZZZ
MTAVVSPVAVFSLALLALLTFVTLLPLLPHAAGINNNAAPIKDRLNTLMAPSVLLRN